MRSSMNSKLNFVITLRGMLDSDQLQVFAFTTEAQYFLWIKFISAANFPQNHNCYTIMTKLRILLVVFI